jgi:hypothetical protein
MNFYSSNNLIPRTQNNKNRKTKGAFDLKKYKRVDMTTSAVLCLILKVFMVLDKLKYKREYFLLRIFAYIFT